MSEKDNLGFVETKYFTFSNPKKPFILESEKNLDSFTLAYETYGKLNEKKTNTILILHALTGDAHVAGIHKAGEKLGWWKDMVGPGKGIDTNKYFVICSNVLGGCSGSTGPSSINHKTGKPYGLDFPIITIKDMVNAQKYLIEHLEIKKILTVIGSSMGGMQVLQWMDSYPERICSAIPIATTMRHSPQQIAFNEVGRQAIIADHNWKNGDYYGQASPDKGLAIARMIGHITYMSDVSMTEKFGRRTKGEKQQLNFSSNFEVERYLHYRGNNFVNRFDANSYLYITKALDYFNLLNGKKTNEIFNELKAKVLVISFKSDWLYPTYQSQEIVKTCKLSGVNTTYCAINSTYGHDAFLLEIKEEANLIKHFLKTVFQRVGDEQK